MKKWSPDSWRAKPIKQYPDYPDSKALSAAENKLKNCPELVSYGEIRKLKEDLALVAQGKAFLLQGGDCAETFVDFNAKYLRDYFRVLLQMTMVLMYGTGLPVVKVGRIAGQFAKPRSSNTEMIDGREYVSYRGDMFNDIAADDELRKPDPQRLLQVFNQSAVTMNYLRSLASGGYASLNRVNKWNLNFVENSPQGERFHAIATQIDNAMKFIAAANLSPEKVEQLSQATFYSSHEGLHLGYEEALTRGDDESGYFCCSGHMLWIGDRTRNPDEAHVEFMRGIENPVGCKVGPSTNVDELLRLIDILNPKNEAGKLTLITRMGADKVGEIFPSILRRVTAEGKNVIWSCDPMHGNTEKAPNGYKTRKFNNILSEVKQFFEVHKAEGTVGGGVHFEMTGQDVTECLGGAQAISEMDLKRAYQTACDPRLNANQSLELAFLIAEELKS
jgi:3-deoxy-7-phosphoheptulonate synthase